MNVAAEMSCRVLPQHETRLSTACPQRLPFKPARLTHKTRPHRTFKTGICQAASATEAKQTSQQSAAQDNIEFHGVHHVGLLVEDLERSKKFYIDTLGLGTNKDRPDGKLPYDGLWLWIGPEMIHLMVLPNPDPMSGRPDHGGRDRHVCVGVKSIEPVEARLKSGNIEYTKSKSGRAAVFFRDPDMNVLEVFETQDWR